MSSTAEPANSGVHCLPEEPLRVPQSAAEVSIGVAGIITTFTPFISPYRNGCSSHLTIYDSSHLLPIDYAAANDCVECVKLIIDDQKGLVVRTATSVIQAVTCTACMVYVLHCM